MKFSIQFTEEQIKNNFPKINKCLVAIEKNRVVGTRGIDNFWQDKTGTKYMILSVL